MIKKLIVDDSPLVRSILRDFLESEGSFEIIGEGENGLDGVNKARELNPDLITMDYEMPVMNGLDAIVEIRKFSSCGIVVVSTHDTAKMAYDATLKGAHDFFAKDTFTSDISEEQQNKIYDTLKQIANIKKIDFFSQVLTNQETHSENKTKAIVIAASTGGPMVLCQLFSALPSDFPIPIFIVQHNTSGFDKGFVQWLNGYSQLVIMLAEDGMVPTEGNVYVAPTDKHMIVKESGIYLDDSEPVCSQKPSADMLFKSAAELYGDSLVSIVLTGMGYDGAEGTRYVKQAGGLTIAQDETSSMIFGMPEAAIKTGCVDHVLAINDISLKLVSLC